MIVSIDKIKDLIKTKKGNFRDRQNETPKEYK